MQKNEKRALASQIRDEENEEAINYERLVCCQYDESPEFDEVVPRICRGSRR